MSKILTKLTDNRLILEPKDPAAWGDPGAWSNEGFERLVGRRLYGVVKFTNKNTAVHFGFDTNRTGSVGGSGLYSEVGFRITDSGVAYAVVLNPSNATEYPICLILAAAGAHLYIELSGRWICFDQWGTNTTSPLYPGVSNYNANVEIDGIHVTKPLPFPGPLSSDGFGRIPEVIDYGAGHPSVPHKVGFGGPENGAYFNGNSYIDIYSAALNSTFDGQEGSLIVRAKVADAAVWSNGVTSKIVQLRKDANNLIQLNKHSLTNTVRVYYIAGGTSKSLDAAISATTFQTLGLTWSLSGDAVKLFVNGSQTGATATGLGTYTGALASDRCYIGTDHNAYGYYPGWESDVIITLNGTKFSDAQHAEIYTKLAAGTLTNADLDGYVGAGNYSWRKLNESYETDGRGHPEGRADVFGRGGADKIWLGKTWYNFEGAAYNSPVLGATLWDAAAAVFTSGTYAWTAAGSNTIANVGNKLVITHVDSDQGAIEYLNNAADLSSDLVVGQWYQFNADIHCSTGLMSIIVMGSYWQNSITSVLSNMFFIGRATNATTNIIRAADMSAGRTMTLDNLSLKPLALNTLFSTVTESTADVVMRADLTITPYTQAGLALCVDNEDDPQNFILIYHNTVNVYVDKYLNGVPVNVLTVAKTYGAQYTLHVDKSGEDILVVYNNQLAGNVVIDDEEIINNTLHGKFNTYELNKIENFKCSAKGTNGEYNFVIGGTL